MGPKKRENTGKALEEMISSLFFPTDEIKEEEERLRRREQEESKEDEK